MSWIRSITCGMVLGFAARCYAAGPVVLSYQIQFPPSPADIAASAKSLDDRATRLLGALACGSEVEYANSQTKAGEDSTAFLIAKMEWVTGHPDRNGDSRIIPGPQYRRKTFHLAPPLPGRRFSLSL